MIGPATVRRIAGESGFPKDAKGGRLDPESQWVPVVRYDMAHGQAHIDLYEAWNSTDTSGTILHLRRASRGARRLSFNSRVTRSSTRGGDAWRDDSGKVGGL